LQPLIQQQPLHGHNSVAELCVTIKNLAARHFGRAARRFLARLVRWRAKDKAGLVAWVEARRASYLKRARRIEAPGRHVERIHQKMATLYAAGCLAIRFGVVPLKRKELREALLACTRDHVAQVARDEAQRAAGS
jgi:putative DNA primase/helicase